MINKKAFAPLFLISLFLLTSCQNGGDGSKISLYRANSRLVYTSVRGPGSAPLATYRHAELGDAPYVELGEFFAALDTDHIIEGVVVEKLADHLYAVSQQRVIAMLIDPAKDIITCRNLDYLYLPGNEANGSLGWDVCAPNDDPSSCVHTSYLTDSYGDPQDSYYDFGAYGFDIVEGEEGKLYVPYQPFGSFLFARETSDVTYNGIDFFYTQLINKEHSKKVPGAYCSFYANEGEFLFAGDYFSSCDPVGEEAYRFYSPSEEGVTLFCLEKDGTVAMKTGASKEDAGTPAPLPKALTYQDESDGIYVSTTDSEAPSVFKIPKEKAYFNTKKRSPSIAKHSYDVLRFEYENLYGLKEELYARYDVKSIEELIVKKGLKDKLLSTDSLVYDEGLCEFLMGNIDDGHTKYPNRCLFSGDPSAGTTELVDEKLGPRRKALFEKKTAYQDKRTETMTALDPSYSDPAKQIGCFFEGETAVIRFDEFSLTSLTRNFRDGRQPVSEDITSAFATSTDDGAYLSMKEIEKHPEVKNVVIDLSVNGGGIAALLPYLAAIWTDDPTFYNLDVKRQVVKEFHYQVDFNRNGVFGEEGDTYKGKYNFFVLISDFSFSCGNGLPTMAYADGITLIGGPHGGGGACPVATMSDGSGTIFNTSMPIQIVYPVEDGFVNNDEGIPVAPEHQLPLDSWYDLPKLNAFVNGLNA